MRIIIKDNFIIVIKLLNYYEYNNKRQLYFYSDELLSYYEY